MRAGPLRHRVKIQKAVTSRNSVGEEVVSWADDGEAWASVAPLSGRELFAAQQIQSAVTHNVRMRYRSMSTGGEIGPKCRIAFGERTLTIDSVINPDERKIYLDLLCKETT